jgi:hypothetical protein
MKKKSILLIGMLILVIYPGGVYACVSASSTSPPPVIMNSNSMMGGASVNAANTGLQLKEMAHSLLDQASAQGIDISKIADVVARADTLMEKAQQILRFNPIPANNMAREAVQLYESAISDLEVLLS